MGEETIEFINAWPESQSIRDILVFLDFANFYRQFIKSFSRTTAPLTLMLKTTVPLITAQPVCIRANKNEFGRNDGGGICSSRIDSRMANLSNSKKEMSSGTCFFTPKLA